MSYVNQESRFTPQCGVCPLSILYKFWIKAPNARNFEERTFSWNRDFSWLRGLFESTPASLFPVFKVALGVLTFCQHAQWRSQARIKTEGIPLPFLAVELCECRVLLNSAQVLERFDRYHFSVLVDRYGYLYWLKYSSLAPSGRLFAS